MKKLVIRLIKRSLFLSLFLYLFFKLSYNLTTENSKCICRRNVSFNNQIKYLNNETLYLKRYNYTCDSENVLRRGPNQRVISYSVYGWIMRVYHDSSLSDSVICEFECKIDIIDFCNVDRMPFGIKQGNITSLFLYNSNYTHAMMWRWYPIGDDYVDYFMSRDADSKPIQREKDSVDVWLYLKTDTLFHIMRDHPLHDMPILGGLWGYANHRNREIGRQIFKKILNRNVQNAYNKERQNLKDFDQLFLRMQVWNIARKNATIHDSYTCEIHDGNSFPSQRSADMFCFVGCFLPCCDKNFKQSEKMPKCPKKCRPQNHQDWLYC